LFLGVALLLFHGSQVSAKFVPETHTMVRTNTECVNWRTIEMKPGPHAPEVHFYNRLNPVWWFKNSDDPVPPAWYRPNEKHREMKWSFRNPLHNFDFYVIGVADKTFYRSGKFPDRNSDPRGGWDFAAARWKFIWLPFVSYHREKVDFYLGWRNHGNFGIKFNLSSKKDADKEPAAAVQTTDDVGTSATKQ
jgi:hypothetical protein